MGLVKRIVEAHRRVRGDPHDADTIDRRTDQAGNGIAVIDVEIVALAALAAEIGSIDRVDTEVEHANEGGTAPIIAGRQSRRPVDGRHPVIDMVDAGEAHQAVIESQEEFRPLADADRGQAVRVVEINTEALQQGVEEGLVHALAGARFNGRPEHAFGAIDDRGHVIGDRREVTTLGSRLIPFEIEVTPNRADLLPEGIDVAPKRIDVVAEERIDVAPEGIDVATEEGVDVPAEGIDVAPERIDIPPEGRDVAVEGINVTAERIDITPEGIDVPPERIDVTVKGVDVPR